MQPIVLCVHESHSITTYYMVAELKLSVIFDRSQHLIHSSFCPLSRAYPADIGWEVEYTLVLIKLVDKNWTLVLHIEYDIIIT